MPLRIFVVFIVDEARMADWARARVLNGPSVFAEFGSVNVPDQLSFPLVPET